jgi:hypothetical protein
MGWLEENLGGVVGAGAGAALAKEGYDRLGEIGEQAYREMGQLGRDLCFMLVGHLLLSPVIDLCTAQVVFYPLPEKDKCR